MTGVLKMEVRDIVKTVQEYLAILIIPVLFLFIAYEIYHMNYTGSNYMDEGMVRTLERPEETVTIPSGNQTENNKEIKNGVIKIFDEGIRTNILKVTDEASEKVKSDEEKNERKIVSRRGKTGNQPKIRVYTAVPEKKDGYNISTTREKGVRIFQDGVKYKVYWPVKSEKITSRFGKRLHPILNKVKFHRGVDIAAPIGTEVFSGIRGKVTYAGIKGGYGNFIEVMGKEGIKVRYAHLSRIYVREGEEVHSGDRIAEVGNTGLSTGPHLHYEVVIDEVPVDPLRLHDLP